MWGTVRQHPSGTIMVEIAFPETSDFITRRPTAVGLSLKRLLIVVYVFGGVSSLIALLSKFVIEPLFDQLTQDRKDYAVLARSLLEKLNTRLSNTVSYIPPVSYTLGSRKYVDAQVQTESSSAAAKSTASVKSVEDMKDAFRQLSANTSLESSGSMKMLLEDLTGYVHSLAYPNLRGAVVDIKSLGGNKSDTYKQDMIQELKKDIRAVKGSLLSG